MKLGYIGLGKMGFNMVEHLLEKGYAVTVYDTNQEAVAKIAESGAKTTDSLRSLALALQPPRLVWIMIPYQAVDPVLSELVPLLEKGDVVIDGGNSPYKESIRRALELEKQGIDFLDVGVSGGPRGAREGACLMIGGRESLFEKFEGLFRSISANQGYAYMGRSGAGHFVKMVHNGIEYGMMQAIAEGFAIMKVSEFDLNLEKVTEIYNHGSVIESRLIGWLKNVFEEYGEELRDIDGSVSESGEGLWTVHEGKESGSPVPIIEGALNFRLQSQQTPSYIGQILSALRHQFGGHEVFKKGQVKRNG